MDRVPASVSAAHTLVNLTPFVVLWWFTNLSYYQMLRARFDRIVRRRAEALRRSPRVVHSCDEVDIRNFSADYGWFMITIGFVLSPIVAWVVSWALPWSIVLLPLTFNGMIELAFRQSLNDLKARLAEPAGTCSRRHWNCNAANVVKVNRRSHATTSPREPDPDIFGGGLF